MNSYEAIYEIVRRIPCGRVTSYGQIARMLGNPRMSRIVGGALYKAPPGLPCHRVVNREGGLTEHFRPDGRATHRMLLEREGVGFTPEGRVDMARFFWRGD